MTKNIIVLNELGHKISDTYPKRAKGLVKSGRAEYVNDCTIRMLITLDPTIFDNDNMEDFTMSKIICFNTREFSFDKTCQGKNVGSRMFITDEFGRNVEVFEIGDGNAWTQIACEKTLEKNADYVFRFAMTRKSFGFDGGVSNFIIVPCHEGESDDENWENRYTFNLANGEYKPTLNKNVNGKNLKVFEIPFNTYDVEKFRFVFVEHGSVARIFDAADNESYAGFPDADRSFFDETKAQFENILPKDININVGQTLSGAAETFKKAFDKVSSTVVDAAKSFTESQNCNEYHKGANLNASSLQTVLASADEGAVLKYFGCNISNDSDSIDCGKQTDNLHITLNGCNDGGQGFAGFVQALGDNSTLECHGCNVGSYFGNVVSHGGPVDDVNIVLSGCNINESSFARLLAVLDDGCHIDMTGSIIVEENGDFWYGNSIDGLVVDAVGAIIPDKVMGKLYAKFGDGCVVNR